MSVLIEIHQFPCLNDNYGYLVHEPGSGATIAIDTPDAEVYLAEAEKMGWQISEIWNTHWHPDHAGGNLKIKEATGCRIIGPAGEADKIPGIDKRLKGGDRVELGDATATVIDVPGHTLGHIAFHFPDQDVAFVGDAVFALGCGRVFEGTMEMMWESLKRIKKLPKKTRLYCAHEYTASNAKFAVTIEPENKALREYVAWIEKRRAEGKPTVPALLERELETNPFLRADLPEMQLAMGHAGNAAATFGEIRGRKDRF
ncbi:MAG: hydroxyacylglutathione hydrolase [Hyphomonas sp.]|uniref:hydroxyacylglutathione hydrolase n=1 Tax=Hyphomonas sp. TaxID=87 RepID=UPI001D831616|nr:hydroxyacylglutathione hydrolase [Hyphomonas sp.]MBA4228002.1 hydroxyacylglutathione hydrolase [Hyphomonas sp.]